MIKSTRKNHKNMVYENPIENFHIEKDDIIIAFCFDSIAATEDDLVTAYIDGNPPTENIYEWIYINPCFPNWNKLEKQIKNIIKKIKDDSEHRYILCDMYQAIDDILITDIIDQILINEAKDVENLVLP